MPRIKTISPWQFSCQKRYHWGIPLLDRLEARRRADPVLMWTKYKGFSKDPVTGANRYGSSKKAPAQYRNNYMLAGKYKYLRTRTPSLVTRRRKTADGRTITVRRKAFKSAAAIGRPGSYGPMANIMSFLPGRDRRNNMPMHMPRKRLNSMARNPFKRR